MSPTPDAVLGAAQDTVSALPKDPRPPGLRLLIYRSNIDGLDAARGIQCDNAWLDLDATPVRLGAQKPLEDEDIRKSKPPAPMGRAEIVRARLEARGPSRLRYEVQPTDDAQAASATHHKRRRADGQFAGRSGASSLAAVGGQPTRAAGLYGTRRCPTTAAPRARTTAPHSPSTKPCRAPHEQADVDEEPPRTARPTRRVLAERLYGVLPSARPQGMPATAGPPRPTISAPMPLKRKRRNSEDAGAAPPAKRTAKQSYKQARSAPGRHLAESGPPVGRHVQHRNKFVPPPSSHAPSGNPVETKTRSIWRRRMADAWAATIHALAAAVTATRPATKN